MNNENKINYLGVCPVCGKGKIAEGPTVYRCNYAASMTDKCDFHVFKTYNGTEIKEEHIKQLIEQKKTDDMEFTSKEGKPYTAYLYIEDGMIRLGFPFDDEKQQKLDVKCPVCGKDVVVFRKGYGCKGIHETDENGERKCSFWISNVIAQRNIDRETAEELIALGETGFLNDFKNNNGDTFSAKLVLNEDMNVVFNSTICKCPKCGGDIRSGKNAYNCSNYKEKGCDFSVWKEISFREITPDEVKELCEEKSTDVLDGFKNRDGSKTYSAKLVLNDDFNVVLI